MIVNNLHRMHCRSMLLKFSKYCVGPSYRYKLHYAKNENYDHYFIPAPSATLTPFSTHSMYHAKPIALA